jgi:serine aminopeptidase S33 family
MLRTTATAVLLVAAATATATTCSMLLLAPATAPDLRTALAACANASGTTPQNAGEAWHLRGRSFWRAGQKDSAVASYRRALERRGSYADRLALADVLLRRRAPGDTAEVFALLEPVLPALGGENPGTLAAYKARLGWAEHLAGHTDRAMSYFTPIADRLTSDPTWRLRYATVTLDTGDYRRAFELVAPLVVMSRRQDADARALVDRIGSMTGAGARADGDLERRIAVRDRNEAEALDGLHGRRVRFQVSDGEYVSGIVLPPPTRGRPRPALVLMAPGDSLADYDSLGVALARAGFAVMLVEPRGTGRSVSAAVPSPDTWDGRDDAVASRVARDVRDALSALASETPLDTLRATIVAVGPSASIAVQAAELDPRFRAMVLVSPSVEPVDRPVVLERVARLKPAVFVQSSPNDFEQRGFVETLLHTADERISRAVETRAITGGAVQFRYDPKLSRRITDWIGSTLASQRPASGTPRATPRRG